MIKIIKESESLKKFTDEDWDQFENMYMYGSGKLTDVEDIETLNAALQYATKERKYAERHEDYREAAKWARIQDELRNAKSTKKKMITGTYEIEKAITKDVWSCIHGHDVDEEKLSKIKVKYKEYRALCNRIIKKILNKEMWYD